MASTGASAEHECTEKFWDEFWEDEYDEASEDWGSEPNSFLVKHIKKMDGEKKKKKEEIRVLVPMCGTSVDMKWLAEQGYQVVGLEYAKNAVQRFFHSNKIKHTVEKKKDFNVFKADELPLKIYQGDMYKFTSALEPAFDAVWDSASLHAANKKDQKRYADTMKAVVTPDCRYLIDNMAYDPTDLPDGFYDHPHPHLITTADILKLFGEDFQLEEVDSEDKSMDWSYMTGKDKEGKPEGKTLLKYKSKLFLMTRKPSKK